MYHIVYIPNPRILFYEKFFLTRTMCHMGYTTCPWNAHKNFILWSVYRLCLQHECTFLESYAAFSSLSVATYMQ